MASGSAAINCPPAESKREKSDLRDGQTPSVMTFHVFVMARLDRAIQPQRDQRSEELLGLLELDGPLARAMTHKGIQSLPVAANSAQNRQVWMSGWRGRIATHRLR